jgi:hypothetical protein
MVHRMDLRRELMSRNAIVYSSRARTTGALCETIDTRHPEASKLGLPKRPKGQETFRYAARCLDHKSAAFFAEHYPAGRAIAWPQEWCQKCKELFAKGSRIPKPGTEPVKAPAKAKVTAKAPAKTPAKVSANGKRTSDKAANIAAEKVANEQRKPGPVVVKDQLATAVAVADEREGVESSPNA